MEGTSVYFVGFIYFQSTFDNGQTCPQNSSTVYIFSRCYKRQGLGLQGLYSATNCADNILGRFIMILQNQIC